MKKTATQLLCTVLVLCMCLALIPMRANAASGTAAKLDAAYEEARLASYDQFLAYYYLTFSSLDFFLENEQLPFQCYVELADDDFRSELNAWRILTMNAGDQLTYSAAEVEFYEFLIFDILYQEIAEDELLNNAQTGADAFQFSLLKKLADAGFAWSNSMALTSENTEAVVSAMIATDDLKFLAGCGEIIEKGIEYTQTMEHLIEKLYMLVKLNECTEEVCTILDDLYENATNDLMKEACRKMTLVATGLLDEAEIMAIFSGEVALSEVVEYSTDKIWDGLLATTSFGQGIAIGQGVGKLACNLMWSTDAVVENWYSMEKVHIFEQVLKNRVKVYMQRFENNPTLENAKLFNKAADMYLNTLSVGMKYGIQFFEAARGGGFTGWLYKNLFEPEAYEKALGELHTIKNSIDLAINLANNNTYNFYLEELEADIETEVEWVETPCETDEEEVRDTLATLPEILFMLTNQTVTGDTTLTDDQTTYGNYSFSNGSLDLAGHTLTVYGDFYLNGTLNVNGGTLDVRGDLNVTHGYLRLNGGTVNVGGDAIFASKKSDGSYGTTVPDTRLIMNNEADQFIAVGDLITYFDTYYSNGMDCSAGEMRIGGNWINYGSDDKKPNGTFRMIFTGMDDLTINGTDDIYVPTLVIENASQRSITMRGTVSAGTLEGGDMTITAKDSPNLSFNTTTGKLDIRGYTTLSVSTAAGGNITFSEGAHLKEIDLCGHSIQVNGDLQISESVSLGYLATETVGSLTVTGDLHVTGGNLKLNGGTVNVGGDAIFARTNDDGSYSPTSNYTYLTMDNDADRFTVTGNLVTYFANYSTVGLVCSTGEMKIGGGWTHYDAFRNPSGTFRMIFTGTNDLTINGMDDIYVPTVVIENAGQRSITMRGTVSAGTLEGGDMTITAKDSPNLSFNTTTGKLDIRGYTTLSVSTAAGGNITFSEGAHLKEIDLCGHSIQVNGDLQISESVSLGYLATETVGSLTVTGDLHVTGGNLKLNGGTVNVGGDAIFARTNDDGSYSPTSNYTYLTMDNDADRFTVTGNLVTYFANYSTVGLVCSTGEMKIGGGWTHYDAFRNPSGTFRMIFTGTNDLTINGMDDIYVPTVVIENAGQRSITMRGTVSAGTLEGGDMSITAKDSPTISFATTDGDIGLIGSLTLAVSTRAGGDITVDGDLYSKGIAMGANTLTINGDLHMDSNCPLAIGFSGKLIVNGDVWMRTGTLTLSGVTEISGSLYQAGGEVKPNKGQVEIKGDYRIQTWDESSGEMEWTESSGKLYMTNEKDSIVVGGDFYMQSDKSHGSLLTAGCLAVHGDFYQLAGSGYNFAASGTHTVFLCGKYHQSASFESGTSMFNILRLNKPKEYYTFIPDPCWKTLIEGDETPETPTSGTCGENLTWTFDRETSTLTISGTGEMDDYSWQSGNEAYAPWYVWSEQITSIVIEEGVASIGAYAFYDCTDVGEITFLGDAPAMREAIFGGVTATAYYPADNDTWAEDVMQDYGGTITWVLYGDADPHIHNYSEAVTPPTCTEQGFTTYTCACGEQYVDNYVDALGHTLGDWYVVKAPTVDEEGEERRGCENCDYFETRSTDKLPDSEDPEIIASGSCGDGVNWTLYSDGLLVIYGTGAMDDYAWNTQPWNAYLDQILRVEIKEGVTSIGEGTFWDCSGLTVITIPDSLASIGEDAFRACSSLTEITIPDGVASISDSVFQSCTGLTKITIPEGVTSIGDSAFAYCSSLTEITIPDSVTNIGNWVFRSCSSLTEINIPDGVTSISDYVFYGCSNLTEITIPNGVTSIGNCAFRDCSSLTEITVPDGVTSIEDSAFCDCTSLTEINIPDGVTYISAYVFSGCSSLAEITIPDGVTSIGNYAFASMSCLTEITIPDDVISIGYGAFMSCSGLTEITVPDSITSIDDHVFYGCYRLTEITFLGDAPTIADESFRDIRATAYYPAGNDTWTENVRQDYGGIITWEPWGEEEKPTSGTCGGMLTWTYDPKTDTLTITGIGAMFDYIIGNLLDTPVCTANTESAGEAPWAHWSGEISIIVIGEGVTSIGDNAFYMCGVSDLKISGTVTEIGKNAFAACEELETLIVPASVTTIGEGAFSGCVGLREIVFKGDAPEIGDSAFASVEAEATYPGGNDTWNDEMIDNYGGSIIWEPVIPECTDHVYEAVVTAPTCTEQGYTTYTCVGCGDSYVGDYTDPLNHNYEDGSCIHCGQEETEYLLGDVNGDGEVDIFDANLVVGYYNGTVTFNETQILAADVNGDGEVDIFDANLIVAYYNGTIVSFPVEE